ncbi:MAG: N-formylglutamate amidohydrolase [Candidatus Schekmanbacteria bacterium]|nr:N-formylglutamate amidohydrolase [Candidatus Schekmanbacteria bacterium]
MAENFDTAMDRPHDCFVIVDGDRSVPLLLLCEHAGNELPESYGFLGLAPEDLATHWAYDPGIAGVHGAACAAAHCVGIRSRMSRLLVDLNRPSAHAHLTRPHIGSGDPGDPVRRVPANCDLAAAERAWRLRSFYRPYHYAANALGDELAARHSERFLLVSFHSFTPVFGAEDRGFDVGVLYGDRGEIAEALLDLFLRAGLRTRLNEPYSGLRGEDFSPRMHSVALGAPYVEIELNQATIATPSRQLEIGEIAATALRHLLSHW